VGVKAFKVGETKRHWIFANAGKQSFHALKVGNVQGETILWYSPEANLQKLFTIRVGTIKCFFFKIENYPTIIHRSSRHSVSQTAEIRDPILIHAGLKGTHRMGNQLGTRFLLSLGSSGRSDLLNFHQRDTNLLLDVAAVGL